MPALKTIIEDNTTIHGRTFDLIVQFLITLSIVSFSIETLPDLSPSAEMILRQINVATVGIFTVECLLRIAVADNRMRFITSFYGVVDLLAILPFYVSTGLDLRSLRAPLKGGVGVSPAGEIASASVGRRAFPCADRDRHDFMLQR